MNTPITNAQSMQIGRVYFVSQDEIKILLDLDAPNDVTLNTGIPRPFPRINNYVLISLDGGYLVTQIEWITIEQSPFPKRKGIQDFGVIDLPFPLRKMGVVPIGVLHIVPYEEDKERYEFSRGIEIFPTVADPVLMPTQAQLKAIVESGGSRRVKIGVSPMAGNSEIYVDPDRIFGRHMAVLGNTGSGKSCSVAGLIRWSIEAAKSGTRDKPNTRFIILDPNGEFTKSFSDMDNVHVFGAEQNQQLGIEQLQVPLWLWNSDEWIAFTQATGRAQKPTLIQALRSVRDGESGEKNAERISMRRFLKTLVKITLQAIKDGSPWGKFPQNKAFFLKLKKWKEDLVVEESFSAQEKTAITKLVEYLDNIIRSKEDEKNNFDLSKLEVEKFCNLLQDALITFGGSYKNISPMDENIPRPFSGNDFLRSIESYAEIMNTSDYVETMITRVETLLSDAKLSPVISSNSEITLNNWLDQYICPSNKSDGSIIVIDLSLLPADVTHIIVSVMARITLEALQRYRRDKNGDVLPVVLVMEEAHTFIKKYNYEDNESAAAMCSRVFEKIAREGRKYGLGLILSSQRPSELSPTVISQCNSFLLHRISNDRDQELVGRLVPDNLRGLLRELPSLPSRNAVLLGWASEMPVMVRMNYLEDKYRPKSDDPQFWRSWKNDEQTVKWDDISTKWQNA